MVDGSFITCVARFEIIIGVVVLRRLQDNAILNSYTLLIPLTSMDLGWHINMEIPVKSQ